MFGSDGDGDAREMLRERMEMEREGREEELGQKLATQVAMEQGPAEDGYWDIVSDPDAARGPDDEIEDFAATELSSAFALGNVTQDEWDSWKWRIENEFWVMKNEFRDADSKLDNIDVATMYGDRRPRLTNEKARRLYNLANVKKAKSSLSINARGLRAGTEIHAVSRTEEGFDDEGGRGEPEGVFGSLKQWLSG